MTATDKRSTTQKSTSEETSVAAASESPPSPLAETGTAPGVSGNEVASPVAAHTEHSGGGGQASSTLRLPFITATFTRNSPSPAAAGGAGQVPGAQAVQQAAQQVAGSDGRQRLLLYTGAAALGVAGVVDWPVVALVAAGTYVASRSRRSQPTR